MKTEVMLFAIIFVPFIGSFTLPAAERISPRLRNCLALVFVSVSFLLSAIASGMLISGHEQLLFISRFKIMTVQMSFALLGDGLALFMAMTSSLLGAVIIFYSFGYMRHYENQNEYYLMVVLFLGSMMGIVLSANLIFIYVFWEITAICCWRLIGFFRKDQYVIKANKAFLFTVSGALIMLLGFILVYQQTGTFDLTAMKGSDVSNTAVLLILFGILSKSATLPLHTWLPDAGIAPSPVTSLLHAAVLVKIGVYVFARLFIVNLKMDEIWHTVIPVAAAASALISAGTALVENDIKRIIAYSTVSQIGFILLGLSVGNRLSAAGGLLYILMHSLAKGGLFLCAGVVEQKMHTKDIRQMGGLIKTMPLTAICFIICSFSIMGIPPLGGFFSKYMVIGGTVNAGHPWIALTFIACAVLTIIYMLRVFTMVFLGCERGLKAKEGPPSMLAGIMSLAVLSIAGGILIYYPSTFVQTIINQAGVMIK
jgi:NADH:ubiquinone oxidoreductase subunit 5 (subunit L)/multisubunit Na+/H+ antiporter MnhA subunit